MATMTLTGLEIAYTDTGPRNGPAVLLLHGWPDDASTWEAIVPVLTGAGLRVIVPTLRGFGESRFRRADIPRTGDSAILALDAIALMDGLGITRFQVAGHDWGSNIAEALAVGPGDRVLSICSAGDNALALLADDPAAVVAVDLNPAQIACLALRVAAFRTLEHGEILELVGSRDSSRRADLYYRSGR